MSTSDDEITKRRHEATLVVSEDGDAILTTFQSVSGQKTIGDRNATHNALKDRKQFWHLTKSGRIRFGGAEIPGNECPKGGLIPYHSHDEKCQDCEHNQPDEQDTLAQAVGRFCKLAGRNETVENYAQEFSRRNYDIVNGVYDGTERVLRRIGHKYYDDEEQWARDRDRLAEILKTVDSIFPATSELVPEKIEYSGIRILKL